MSPMRTDAKAILREATENLDKLDACPLHGEWAGVGEPILMLRDGAPIFREYRCGRCGGTMQGHKRRMYEDGVAAGRRAARKVVTTAFLTPFGTLRDELFAVLTDEEHAALRALLDGAP